MERSYLTAEVFREILQQNGRSNGDGEIIRTLSGRQVQLAWQSYACTCQSSQEAVSIPVSLLVRIMHMLTMLLLACLPHSAHGLRAYTLDLAHAGVRSECRREVLRYR